jgi:hypothetical protein
VVAPTPVPQRLLPSLKLVQKEPDLQSSSVEQRSHSCPFVHPSHGRTSSKINKRALRRIATLLPGFSFVILAFYPNGYALRGPNASGAVN